METKISPTELAERLTDVLERVRGGERVVVEHDGETIAAIEPVTASPGITVGEFFALVRELPRPDPGFADDLAEIHASQGMAEFSHWPN